ncbi:hypothetical protein [Nitrosomonas sp. Nm166]|uniref:hypothetical protein n=1 Tax=Nitrosomonas sp. Nm166 TaxID=1881054 RepID=UPI0008F413D4|nr:hypothetical protein [Nitrosomonas sp. Nm166]SFD89858.1 hypothetical protein SAMN05428977_100242 [Nitrosomonas sp. Nm166]
MSMRKWTDEELITTRDKLEAWNSRSNSSGTGSKLWLLTAFLGAFAISTGIAFIFFDGVDIMNVVLIIMGTVTCASWYKSDKQRRDNIALLAEINKEIKSRKIKDTSKLEDKPDQVTIQKDSSAAKPQATEMNSKSDKKN